mmetsp:Transcript_25126/g.50505  ORF Transcript_25126/g.50505 Transcript_25126/m.50505 type:complete len:212 (-) Transcript_25126:711-1346(-)
MHATLREGDVHIEARVIATALLDKESVARAKAPRRQRHEPKSAVGCKDDGSVADARRGDRGVEVGHYELVEAALVFHVPIICWLQEQMVPFARELLSGFCGAHVEDPSVERRPKMVARVVAAEPHAVGVKALVVAALVLIGLARETVGSHAQIDLALGERGEVGLRVGEPDSVDVRYQHGASELEQLVERGDLHRPHAPEARLVGADAAKV